MCQSNAGREIVPDVPIFWLDFDPKWKQIVSMRIVKEKFLKDAIARHPKAAIQLRAWRKTVLGASWRNLIEVRTTFPSADAVRVKSGHPVYVFNICGNDFRLLTALHFNMQRIFTLCFLTHAKYSKNKWKLEL